MKGKAIRPPIEAMKTTRPLLRRSSGSIAWVTATWPVRLTAIWWRKSSSGRTSSGPGTARPALLTRPSRPSDPRLSPIVAAAAAIAASSATSTSTGSRRSEAASRSDCASSSRRTPAKTRHPAESRWSAVARPIPVDAPVMRTDFTGPTYSKRGGYDRAMAGKAFVTGGSGFIGGRLVKRLVGEGREVRALARSESSAEKVAALGAEPVRGDLDDRASIAAGAAGCDVAFHLAAHLGDSGPMEDFIRGNVTGAKNAFGGCADAGVRRFVHCGTEAALMAGEPLIDVDETAPLRPESKAPYSATKAQAEIAVRDANRHGFETVVLRPRFVWGAGDTTLLP